jgi:hypothetical protein
MSRPPGPSQSRNCSLGTANLNCCPTAGRAGGVRRHTSAGPASPRSITAMMAAPSDTVRLNTVRQSSAAQAGTTPGSQQAEGAQLSSAQLSSAQFNILLHLTPQESHLPVPDLPTVKSGRIPRGFRQQRSAAGECGQLTADSFILHHTSLVMCLLSCWALAHPQC